MLESLFGNKSAEKVMLALYEHGELHASAIANMNETAVDPIKKQLERFEEAHILLSRVIGRSKLYRFNEKHSLYRPLKDILAIAAKEQKTKNKILRDLRG